MAKPIPTVDRLKLCFIYDQESGVFTHALSRQGVKLGQRADRWATGNYRRIKVDYVDYPAHRCAWAMVHGTWPDAEIDHINGNPADNRICNLRAADRFQQARNSKKPSTSSNRVKGVTKVRSGRSYLWRARVSCLGKQYYVGWYKTEEAAGAAYLAKAKELFGEFASNRVVGG